MCHEQSLGSGNKNGELMGQSVVSGVGYSSVAQCLCPFCDAAANKPWVLGQVTKPCLFFYL